LQKNNNNNNDNKINRTFRALSEKKEHALICYVLPGYPDAKASTALKIVSTMVEAGADIIEQRGWSCDSGGFVPIAK
jgi:Tryptophan synthase alpha chain